LREAEAIIDVLVAESLDFLWRDALPPAARVLDLGTGAGVPGVPLAICAPDLDMTLLDRSHKKITFLRRTLALLQLDNCQALCDSAETFARHLPVSRRFDAVVTRGVGSVAHLLMLTAPLLRPGGKLILRKPQHSAELQEAARRLASESWVDVKTIALPQQGRTPWMLLIVARGLQPVG
jgi:16S rRNA (guanine527-N7)-methyltransferase